MKYKYIPDRGPSKHFHGHETIIENFTSVLEHHLEAKDGTTFLIQGAPDLGKTALLHKLSEVAKKKEVKNCRFDSFRSLGTRESLALPRKEKG